MGFIGKIDKVRILTSAALALLLGSLGSCTSETEKAPKAHDIPIMGTWRLIGSMVIEKGDTVSAVSNKTESFVKIINDSHFAFLHHDISKGKGSTAVFAAGGGRYTLKDGKYTEHLEYCSARNWEGNDFVFTVTLKNDTLTQSGVEKVASIGVDRVNIERYVRVKP
nr:lipocalin-like domain-containing protein [Hymenobacter guriensis]